MHPTLRKYLAEGELAASRYTLGVPRQAPVGLAGTAMGHRAGSSLEFRDHRSYEPGDDLRHIDWSAFGRTDQLTVKLYREEVTPHLDIIVDGSRSMNLEGTKKAEAAVALCAFFATAASRAGYSHSLWTLADRCQPVANGNRAPGLWEGLTFDHRGAPSNQLPLLRPRATRILISDLFWLGEPLLVTRPLGERAAVALVIQLLAHDDVNPPEGRSVRLVDSETDEVREIFVDAIAARRYRDALARHQESWDLACRQAGVTFLTLTAETLLAQWNLDALVANEVLRVR
jgi:uncharacterized protein (DUF58 family)